MDISLGQVLTNIFSIIAVKRQVLTDFVIDHLEAGFEIGGQQELGVLHYNSMGRPFNFDGLSTNTSLGSRVIIISPTGTKTTKSF